jgi:N-acetylglutamate synthase-like GNAT family acetyltransferase
MNTIRPARTSKVDELSDLTTRPTFVLERAGSVVGSCSLEPIAERRGELWFLFVEPAEIGRGHGRRLLEHAKAEAMARGFSSMLIRAGPNAVGFCRRLGGVLVGSRPSDSIPSRELRLPEICLK